MTNIGILYLSQDKNVKPIIFIVRYFKPSGGKISTKRNKTIGVTLVNFIP